MHQVQYLHIQVLVPDHEKDNDRSSKGLKGGMPYLLLVYKMHIMHGKILLWYNVFQKCWDICLGKPAEYIIGN